MKHVTFKLNFGILSRVKLFSIFLFLLFTSNYALADCPDYIKDPGYGTSVKYKVSHLSLSDLKCKKSGNRYWKVPKRRGLSCAATRIDKCSYGPSKYLFTNRDKKLMTPSCNQHDLCYSTEGTSKANCDKNFLTNLSATKNKFNGQFSAVDAYAAVVVAGALGNEGYSKGQKWGRNNSCSYYQTYHKLPGLAKDVTDGWIIGTNSSIYRWNSKRKNWDKMPGSAERIGGTYANPWVININKQIYHWDGSKWNRSPGLAKDIADGWIIGTKSAIYRWNNQKKAWDKMPGQAERIGGTYANPWIINKNKDIFNWTGNHWKHIKGAALDVADGLHIGVDSLVYRWNNKKNKWDKLMGVAVTIGGNPNSNWVINKNKNIYKWVVTK